MSVPETTLTRSFRAWLSLLLYEADLRGDHAADGDLDELLLRERDPRGFRTPEVALTGFCGVSEMFWDVLGVIGLPRWVALALAR
jgi:hypothetical protein